MAAVWLRSDVHDGSPPVAPHPADRPQPAAREAGKHSVQLGT